jgi:hypothetical protein
MSDDNEHVKLEDSNGPETTASPPQLSPRSAAQTDRGRVDTGGDDRRRKRGGQERRWSSGYGDGIERATCIFYRHTLPPNFPVNQRPGLATSRPIEVDRRVDSVLLCDQNHDGDCLWPDGGSVSPGRNHGALSASAEAAEVASEPKFDASPGFDSGLAETKFTQIEGNPPEEASRSQSEQGGNDQDRDRPGIPDQDRGDERRD